ncbi:hypothetical protein MLD38_036730 [Melastoma candidum]|uniref:Uncharacterized protein n=1 Tax=Melastoma candidum TaxID=119954 RepID=A0ACB9LKF8_9MYRT|nr:hypothetical protein MLD38_036730 [Melastoma candidum]
MADVKVTRMEMKVDLQCSKCYKKIKRVLCRYPQIRDQIYDKENNKVFITVVCCSPECIKEKIIRRGGNTVESIKIMPDKPKEPVKPPANSQASNLSTRTPGPSKNVPNVPWNPLPPPPPPPGPVPMYHPIGVCCCCCCYEGGLCHHGWGLMCSDGCGQPAYECQGGNRGYTVSSCCEYLSEENPWGCRIM